VRISTVFGNCSVTKAKAHKELHTFFPEKKRSIDATYAIVQGVMLS